MSSNFIAQLTQHKGSVFAHPVLLTLGVLAILKTLGFIDIDFSQYRRDN